MADIICGRHQYNGVIIGRVCPICEAEEEQGRTPEDWIRWMRIYIGLLCIELGDLMGLAIAHGFTGWPDHKVVGDRMRAELGIDETWTDGPVEEAKAELGKGA